MKFDRSSRQEELREKKETMILVILCVALLLFIIFGVNWDWVLGLR